MTCRTCTHVCVEGFPDPHGVCRRFPPKAIDPSNSTFPLVHLDKFTCGEFVAAKKTANPAPLKPGSKRTK